MGKGAHCDADERIATQPGCHEKLKLVSKYNYKHFLTLYY